MSLGTLTLPLNELRDGETPLNHKLNDRQKHIQHVCNIEYCYSKKQEPSFRPSYSALVSRRRATAKQPREEPASLMRPLKLGSEELGSLVGVTSIAEMRRQNSTSQISITDSVPNQSAAEDLVLVAGEVGDLAAVSAELGVTEADSCLDLVLDLVFDVFDSAVDDSGTLAEREIVSIGSLSESGTSCVVTCSQKRQCRRQGTWNEPGGASPSFHSQTWCRCRQGGSWEPSQHHS